MDADEHLVGLDDPEAPREPTWHEVYGLPAPPPPPKPTRARQARERRQAKFTPRSYRRLSRLGAKVEYIAAVPGESTAQVRVDFGPDDRFDFAALSIIQTGRLPRRRPCVVRLPRGRRGRTRAPRRSSSSSSTSGADPGDEDPGDEGPEPPPPDVAGPRLPLAEVVR